MSGQRVLVVAAVTAAVIGFTVAQSAQAFDRGLHGARGCGRADVLKTVFPTARSAWFSTRSPSQWSPERAPYFPGRCGAWRRTYSGYLGPGVSTEDLFFRQPSTDVSVTLYKTRREALTAAFTEGGGPIRVLANGVRMRSSVGVGYIEDEVVSWTWAISVVRNVVVSSTGTWPHGVYSASQEEGAAMRIHRLIHVAVLRRRS